MDECNSFVTDEIAQQYHESILKKAASLSNGQTLADRFPQSDKQLVSLLESMLEYNPVYRPSAYRLISLPIFDDIRRPPLEHWHEKFADRLEMCAEDCEQIQEHDLDKWRAVNYRRDLTKIQSIRRKLIEIVTRFKRNTTIIRPNS